VSILVFRRVNEPVERKLVSVGVFWRVLF